MAKINDSLTKLKTSLQVVLGTSFAGWLIALYSLWHRQTLLNEGLSGPSFCTINTAINCDAVAMSDYSAFLGVPVATFGMIYYGILIILGSLAYFQIQDEKHEAAPGLVDLLFASSVFALLPTVALAAISVFAVKSVCIMCIGNYIANLVVAFFAFQARGSVAEAFGTKHLSAQRGLAVGVRSVSQATWIVLMVSLGGHLFIPKIFDTMSQGRGGFSDDIVKLAVQQTLSRETKNFTTEGFPGHGPVGALVTIVEFSDFECPHCAHSARTLPPLLQSYGDQIRTVYKNYPLDSACNPKMEGPGHPFACRAAKTGLCVFKNKGNDAFMAYRSEIFENQRTLTNDFIKNTALKSGMVDADLSKCVEDPATHDSLLVQVNEGIAAGIQGTPSIYVNGHLVETGPQPKILKALIDHEIESRSGTKPAGR